MCEYGSRFSNKCVAHVKIPTHPPSDRFLDPFLPVVRSSGPFLLRLPACLSSAQHSTGSETGRPKKLHEQIMILSSISIAVFRSQKIKAMTKSHFAYKESLLRQSKAD